MAIKNEVFAWPLMVYAGIIAYQTCQPLPLETEITPLEDVLGCTLSECKNQKPICREKHICLNIDNLQCVGYD